MYKPSSIQQVKDKLDIITVIGHFIKLDRHGKACCPLHGEKTPSFSVDAKREIFKCFGCGEGGDAIAFVMKHENYNFIQAIEKIAEIIGITLEREEIVDKKKYEAEKSLRDQMETALQFTIETYRKQLWSLETTHPVRNYIRERKLTQNEVAEWQIGWSTTDWRFLSPSIINKNLYTPSEKLGLVKQPKISSPSGDGGTYDGYRSRIIIPIQDAHGKYIGLGGRYFKIDPADEGKNFPKYINPNENELYNKSKVLFGLSKAGRTIKDLKFAYLVEGYVDVIMMHKGGHQNTVATCGTALTDQQCKLLSQYTTHVCILRDSDDAGMKAAQKDLFILLRNGFKVSIVTLPKGDDPDSYVSKQLDNSPLGDGGNNSPLGDGGIALLPPSEDAIYWHVRNLVEDAKDDTYKTALVKQEVVFLLSQIGNGIIRSQYLDAICKKYKWKSAELQKELNAISEEKEADENTPLGDGSLAALPDFMNKEEFMQNGFCEVKNKKYFGYYGFGASGKVELTNFLIKPLIHIYAAKESRYMIQIDNGKKKAVLDIEAKAMVSIDLLQQYVVSEGAFIIYGNKAQMLRIANHLLQQFPLCREVAFLGWQAAGFFAYVNKVFIPNSPSGDGGGLKDLDEWGIIKHSPSGDGGTANNYLIPAASAAYKEVIGHSTGDPYENLRFLTFVKSQINFSQWASLIHRVYEMKGAVAIAYTILTAFRDIIFSIDNNCPHLYAFGERSSGKSKWAESITAFFFIKRQAFNLNSGTDFAFFNFMQIFINCPAHLNEADEKFLKPEWFQVIKGAFDGEGRQRGVVGSKNKTEIMKIQSTLILTGQYLMTTDDNSIVSRSLIEAFTERELTEDDKQNYTKLKTYEEAGLTSMIAELIQHRKEFKETYKESFNENLSMWRRTLNADSGNFNQRIMQNWCHLYTCYFLMGKYHKLPVSNEAFENYCKNKAVHWSGFIRASDTLSEFWNTFAFLVDQGIIIDGWDFKIENALQVKITTGKKDGKPIEYTQTFNEETKVLYLRLNNVHKHYQQAYRSRTGKEGMSIENLKHYFSGRKYYLGQNKGSRFKRFIYKTEEVTQRTMVPGGTTNSSIETKKAEESINNSSYVFLYDPLGVDIERSKEDNPEVSEEGSNDIPF